MGLQFVFIDPTTRNLSTAETANRISMRIGSTRENNGKQLFSAKAKSSKCP
jgi:hypothetical protein